MKYAVIGGVLLILILFFVLTFLDFLNHKNRCEQSVHDYFALSSGSSADGDEMIRLKQESEKICKSFGIKSEAYQSVLEEK